MTIDPARVQSILVIQLGPFGDVLLTTAYFAALKARFPDARLSYLTKQRFSIIVRDHPYIDELITLDRAKTWLQEIRIRSAMIKHLRRRNFDIVIDQQNKPSTQLLTRLSGARIRLGYADARFNMAYNLKARRGPMAYAARKRFDMVAPLGVVNSDYRLHYVVSAASQEYADQWLQSMLPGKKSFALLSPGSPKPKKKWRPDHYAKLADLLSARLDLEIVWIWGPGEEHDTRHIAWLMSRNSHIAPATDFNQAAAFLKRSRIFICNDDGINHVAAAIGANTLALFGPTKVRLWSPASDFSTHHHLHVENCDSKDNSFCISPEQALAKVSEIIGRTGSEADSG